MFKTSHVEPFVVKDCALLNIATGQKAQNLRELRNQLSEVSLGSIYHHFWGGLLRQRFDAPQYNNDFAEWVRYGLQDRILAERLSIINPAACADMECLRQQLLEAMERRLDETEIISWAEPDMQFHFVSSQILVFDTGETIEEPEQLGEAVSRMSVGSLFYHFIDARRRAPDMMDDFRSWLRFFSDDYEDLCLGLASVDPYFSPLLELRAELANLFTHYFQGVSG